MPETVAWWKKEARVWRGAAEAHMAERDKALEQVGELEGVICAAQNLLSMGKTGQAFAALEPAVHRVLEREREARSEQRRPEDYEGTGEHPPGGVCEGDPCIYCGSLDQSGAAPEACSTCRGKRRVPGPCPADKPGCCVIHWIDCPSCGGSGIQTGGEPE